MFGDQIIAVAVREKNNEPQVKDLPDRPLAKSPKQQTVRGTAHTAKTLPTVASQPSARLLIWQHCPGQ